MDKKIKLKPCPFCGGAASVYEHENFVFIRCQICDCGTPSISANINYCASECVADMWNRRADNG